MDNFCLFVSHFEKEIKDEATVKLKYSHLKSEDRFISGMNNLKNVFDICLNRLSVAYEYTRFQYECFLKAIPVLLPTLFGVNYYMNKKKDIDDVLNPFHTKLHYKLVGSRRDGKSAYIASIVSAILCTLWDSDHNIPLFGPTEATGCLMLSTIDSMLNIVKGGLSCKKMTKKLTVINKEINKKNVVNAFPLSERTTRGISYLLNFFDEQDFMQHDKFQKLHLSRMAKERGSAELCITTPNPECSFYDRFKKSDELYEIDRKGTICDICIENFKNRVCGYETLHEAQDMCIKLGHIEPNDAPWLVDKSTEKMWSKYFDDNITATELHGLNMSSQNAEFSSSQIDKFFSQVAFDRDTYDQIHIGIDPADKGKSEYALSFFVNYLDYNYLISANAFTLRETEDEKNIIYKNIVFVLDKISSKLTRTSEIYIWIECKPCHLGAPLQQLFDGARQYKVIVMKGLHTNQKNRELWGYGIDKTEQLTESYVKTLRGHLVTNRVKISESFFTMHEKGKLHILDKLKEQWKRYKRDKNGKLTGKAGPSKNDDLFISFLMVPELVRQSKQYKNPFYEQVPSNSMFFG